MILLQALPNITLHANTNLFVDPDNFEESFSLFENNDHEKRISKEQRINKEDRSLTNNGFNAAISTRTPLKEYNLIPNITFQHTQFMEMQKEPNKFLKGGYETHSLQRFHYMDSKYRKPETSAVPPINQNYGQDSSVSDADNNQFDQNKQFLESDVKPSDFKQLLLGSTPLAEHNHFPHNSVKQLEQAQFLPSSSKLTDQFPLSSQSLETLKLLQDNVHLAEQNQLLHSSQLHKVKNQVQQSSAQPSDNTQFIRSGPQLEGQTSLSPGSVQLTYQDQFFQGGVQLTDQNQDQLFGSQPTELHNLLHAKFPKDLPGGSSPINQPQQLSQNDQMSDVKVKNQQHLLGMNVSEVMFGNTVSVNQGEQKFHDHLSTPQYELLSGNDKKEDLSNLQEEEEYGQVHLSNGLLAGQDQNHKNTQIIITLHNSPRIQVTQHFRYAPYNKIL